MSELAVGVLDLMESAIISVVLILKKEAIF